MANEIIGYFEACQREGGSLQKGMNFQRGHGYSVIIMSVRPNAPYHDRFEDDGTTLIYEGHDVPHGKTVSNPKAMNQPEFTPTGRLTENGKFHKAAQDYKQGLRSSELVKVYEKIKAGIWSYNGLFQLVDSWRERSGRRQVFKFKLVAIVEEESSLQPGAVLTVHRRIIPTTVKLEVWKRDGGKCVVCGKTTELHFDHVLPFSKGRTSITAENVQLLCVRHNLEKSNKIV